MDFTLLERITLPDGATTRSVSLYEGDLTAIPPAHRCDLLVISAYPDNYDPVPGTLVAGLEEAGLKVADLAAAKLHDMRPSTGFWLSRDLGPIGDKLNARQIACFEPGVLGSAPSAVGALFQGLFPFLGETGNKTVAMPLLASGHQGWPVIDMLIALLDAACHWMQRGLAIDELKIVLRPSAQNATLAGAMKGFAAGRASIPLASVQSVPDHDIFLSYSSHDADAAAIVTEALKQRPDVRSVFDFRFAIDTGSSWQAELDRAISSCRSIVAVLSPDYLASAECKEELMQGRLRHKKAGGNVLFPIYWREIGRELDLWLQVMNFVDCRESNAAKLAESVRAMPQLALGASA